VKKRNLQNEKSVPKRSPHIRAIEKNLFRRFFWNFCEFFRMFIFCNKYLAETSIGRVRGVGAEYYILPKSARETGDILEAGTT